MNAIAIRTTARVDSSLIAFRGHSLSRAGSGMKLGLLQGGLLAALSLASAACSSVNAATPPVAPVSTGAAACHATGETKVLARRVFVPGGVAASAEDGSFFVRFAPDSAHCAALDVPTGALRTTTGSCSAAGAETATRANEADETMLAWESHEGSGPNLAAGVASNDAPRAFFGFGIAGDRHAVARSFHLSAPGKPAGETAPALAPIGHDRFLLAWVDGDSESHQLRAQSVVGWGEPLGASMVLSPADASVIGHPSVVVAPTGYGLVTYVASIEGEFDVLATPVSCAMN
jgi:hypothetical protein